MGGRIGWRVEFFCLDLDAVLWVGESLRNFYLWGGGGGVRGIRGWAGLFPVGGRRGYGMMMKWAEEDQRMHGLRPAMDRTGCWRIGVGDVYH